MESLTDALPALIGAFIGGATAVLATLLGIRAEYRKHRADLQHAKAENRFKARYDAASAYLAAWDDLYRIAGRYGHNWSDEDSRALDAKMLAIRRAGIDVEVLFGQAVRDIMRSQEARLSQLVEPETAGSTSVKAKIHAGRSEFIDFVSRELTPDERLPSIGRGSGRFGWTGTAVGSRPPDPEK
ncbi:hypothetical protein [Microlunatus sp. GCM10028923]|uniref:hypothetical protein n=1 Tax=Microlunatus sp. GCM10028923 TaxID=3273400 RepID=UPI003614B556